MKHSFYSMLLATAFVMAPLTASATDYTKLSSKDVQIVQQALADAGFYRAGVDGFYGPMTVNGIASFQAAKGLPQTGQLDDVTLRTLSPQYAAIKQVPNPEQVKIFVAEETRRLDQIAPASGSMARDDVDWAQ